MVAQGQIKLYSVRSAFDRHRPSTIDCLAVATEMPSASQRLWQLLLETTYGLRLEPSHQMELDCHQALCGRPPYSLLLRHASSPTAARGSSRCPAQFPSSEFFQSLHPLCPVHPAQEFSSPYLPAWLVLRLETVPNRSRERWCSS